MMKTTILKVYSEDTDYGALAFKSSLQTVGDFVSRIQGGGENCQYLLLENGSMVTGELIEVDAEISEEAFASLRDEMVEKKKNTNYYWVGFEETSPKPNVTKCTECGGTSLTEFREDYEYLQGIGIPVILTKIPKWTCMTCGEGFTGIPNSDALDNALAWYFINLNYRLGGSEFHFLRKISGISRDKLVDTINEDVYSTILNWERGTEVVPWEADRKLRELAAKEFKLDTPPKDFGKDCDGYRILTIKALLKDGDWLLTVASGIKS